MTRILWIGLAALLLIACLSFEHSLRLDTAEGAIAGYVLAHPKHPPLPFFLIELARPSYWLLFAFSYGCIAVGMLIMRQFSALTASLCLAFPFIIYAPAQMNHNIALYPLACATLYTLWKSLDRGTWRDWLLFGAVVGISFYAKYAIVLLLAPFALAMLFVPTWRKHLFTLKPYVAVIVAAIVVIPHLIALLKVTSVSPLREGAQNFLQHFTLAGGWLFNVALLVIPLLLIVRPKTIKPQSPFELFTLIAAFGGIIIVTIAGLVFGVRPRPYWLFAMTPGIALWAAQLNKNASPRPAYLYAFSVLAVWLVFKTFAPLFYNKPHYADYDARETAKIMTKYWGKTPNFILYEGEQKGRQLAGSLIYEMNPTPKIYEYGRPSANWNDEFLVVSTKPLTGDVYDSVKISRPIANRPFKGRLEATDMWLGKIRYRPKG
jgi:4-amino-4-deoxy-L-arabinose transferase-like glycosyltransferase